MLSSRKNIRRYLTQRYILAVALIAILATTAFASIAITIEAQESAGTVINVSGKQRMLSQRIGFYAMQLVTLKQQDQRATRETLQQLVDSMQSAHQGLIKGSVSMGLPSDMSDTVRTMYFDEPMQLDKQVKEYLQLAETILATPSHQLGENTPALVAILEQSPDLLHDLNLVVNQYELEAKENVDFLRTLEFGVLLATFVVLMLEVIFIFRPMVQSVSALHKEIDKKESLLSIFVKHTPAAVAMFDRDINYIAASDRWYSDYGLKDRDIIGKNHYDIFPEIPKYHPEWLDIHQRVIDGEVIQVDEEAFTRQNGAVDWLRYELRPWKEANGEIGGLVMFTENITERKQMDIMKDEFISTVNHELRTPLTSIQMSLGLLRSTAADDLDAEGQKVLGLAYNNCERLTHLVNDILDMEKIAAGKVDYNMEEVEVCSLVTDIIERHQGYANRYQVMFDLKLETDEVYCHMDSSRFNQALVNLLSNASKFSPEGETVTIKVKENNDKWLEVSVADNGSGIPEAFKDKIFDKFAQADSSSTRAKGGTGLGLNITKSIIEAFGGEVSFESEEGFGTTFYFMLPISAKHKQSREA